jgi:hypothetical protein
MVVYSGKVVEIESDKFFCNKKVAKVDVGGDYMYFFVKKMNVCVGTNVEIHKEDGEIKYEIILIK